MAMITGTSAADSLVGSSSDDEITGLGGNDTLVGRGGADSLLAGAGEDALFGSTGADKLAGGAGNDTLAGGAGKDKLIYDAADASINGGAGTDTLKVPGAGLMLDLTGITDSVIKNVEVIRLTGTGDNALVLAASDLLALSSTSDTLRVDGRSGDVVTTVDTGWLQGLNVVIGGQTYAQYTNGRAILQVDTAIDRSAIDTTVSKIALSNLNGTNGLRLDGISEGEGSGYSVASAGDMNGDGFDDILVGAPHSGSLGRSKSYVVFGKAEGFAASLDLGSLNGANGFRFDGVDPDNPDYTGISVASARDVNADGFADVIIGAPAADPSGEVNAGESYVVFGKTGGFASSLDLAGLDGTDGFRIDGIDFIDFSGRSVASAGDVNGDGFADVIIGAPAADPSGEVNAGESYVVFGKTGGFVSSLDLASLDGTNGFRVDGINEDDFSGLSVASAGDVNGDGFDDVIIGAVRAGPGGASYVVFGKTGGSVSSLDLASLDGTNGFRVDGIDEGDSSGVSVASAGDVNGDGFDDVIIGAVHAGPGGASYVVFGKTGGFVSSLDLASLDGTNGFRVDGINEGDASGLSVASAGDVNGDGFDDIVVGAILARPNGFSSGASYVVFGQAGGFASSLGLIDLDGTNGFRIDGIDAGDFSGIAVASAGDVNGDGFGDLIIGADGAKPGGVAFAGESYVVFGGDFTGAVAHLGMSGADSVISSSAAETFVSGQGNDTLRGGGGADVFRAGAGNDRIRVSSTEFANVDGGSGTDTLAIKGSGLVLDLTTLANNKISGIERMNITGSGNNMLELSMRDLFDLSDTTNQLRVIGNAGDTVDLAGTWNEGGVAGAYHSYTRGAATILIDTDIFVT